MKKIKRLITVFALLFAFVALSAVSVFALADEPTTEPTDGEEFVESVIELTTEPEELSEGATEDKTFISEEELKEILSAYLTDNQKVQAEKTANLLVEKFGVSSGAAYAVAFIGALLIGVILFLITALVSGKVKNGKTNERLNAVQALLTEKDISYEKLIKALDDEALQNLFATQITNLYTAKKGEIVDDLAKVLNFDKDSMTKILGDVSTLTVQTHTIIEALRVLALKANQTEMANVLTENPLGNSYAEMAYENQKLKSALGDEAVKKVLGNGKETN